MTSESAVIFGVEGLCLTPDEKRFFTDVNPWGFILFTRNLENHDQIRALTAELRTTLGRDLPILIDQEGGRVQRLRAPLASDWPFPQEHVKGLPLDTARKVMRLRAQIIGSELMALGINVNCAPMLDLPTPEAHPIIADRAYGPDSETVTALGRAVMDGQSAAGILSVLKHMPGHGRATVDTHLDLPRIMIPLDGLQSDFAPFRALQDCPLGMSAHVIYDALDPENCATQSNAAINYIRTDIGFDGAIMTDDLSMQALKGTHRDRATKALTAGCDLILHCNGNMNEMVEVASVIPRLTGLSAMRTNRAIGLRTEPEAFDLNDARQSLTSLLKTKNV